MKKILFCDMDGTIIDLDGLLYPPDKETVEIFTRLGTCLLLILGEIMKKHYAVQTN